MATSKRQNAAAVTEWRTSQTKKLDALLDAVGQLTSLVVDIRGRTDALTLQVGGLESKFEEIDGELSKPLGMLRYDADASPSEYNAVVDELVSRGTLPPGADAEEFLVDRGFDVVKRTKEGIPLSQSFWKVKNLRLV